MGLFKNTTNLLRLSARHNSSEDEQHLILTKEINVNTFALRGDLKAPNESFPMYDRVRVVGVFPPDLDSVNVWIAFNKLKLDRHCRLTVPTGMLLEVRNCHNDELLWKAGTTVPAEWLCKKLRFRPYQMDPKRVV